MRHKSSNFRLMPVYKMVTDQLRFQCGAPCEPFLRVVGRTAYVPFQMVFDEDMGMPTNVRLSNVCDQTELGHNYIDTVVRSQKDTDNDGVDEWIYTFYGGNSSGIPAGIYYVRVEFPGGIQFYTEEFCHRGSGVRCEKEWKLEYSHSCDDKSLGEYSMNFKNELWLDDLLFFRDGEIESVVARKDGFGVEKIIARDVRPKWFFEFMGNAWLLDSLSYLKLYDQITLTRVENSEVLTLQNIEIAGIGDTTSCMFPIRLGFTKESIQQTKCCDSVYEQAPVPANCAGMAVHLTNDFTLCAGESVELIASIVGGAAPFIVVWSNGETGSSITVSPTETTTYIATAIDAFGCVKQDEVVVTVIECAESFTAEITPSASPVCAGTEVDLDLVITGGTGPFNYLWSTGATTQDITVTPETTTVYSVTITDTATMDVVVANIGVLVNEAPVVTIQSNECFMSILTTPVCGVTEYLWQIESAPDTWTSAPGVNTGTSYSGISGSNYRLKVTCDTCVGYSNEITVTCSEPCTTEILSVGFFDNELTVIYASDMGSLGFQTGYLILEEAANPNTEDCSLSTGWTFVINVTLTSENDTVVIPFIPNQLPTCVRVFISINAGECTDTHYEPIS